MHEAASVERAIAGVVSRWPVDRVGGHLELAVRDSTRAEPMAVSFYATAILRDLGLDEVDFEVTVDPTRCTLCGATSVPTPAHPICSSCGSPLRAVDGPAITCREVGAGRRSEGAVH